MPSLSEFWRQGTVNGMFNLAVRAIYHSPSSFWGNKSCSIDKTSRGMNKPTENIQSMLLIHPEPEADSGRKEHTTVAPDLYCFLEEFGHEECDLLQGHGPVPQHQPANVLVHESHCSHGKQQHFPLLLQV